MIRLVRPDLHLMDAALRGDDVLAEALGCDVAAGWATFTEALKPTRDTIAASPDGSAWGARFFVTSDPPELVGWGGFKGPPDDGDVELGYEIAESRRGQGIATAATRAMLAEAFSDEAVTAVIAHTLPGAQRVEPHPREVGLRLRWRGPRGRRRRVAFQAGPIRRRVNHHRSGGR